MTTNERPARSTLRVDRVLETIVRLERRISERFPDSGLSRVCGELRLLTSEAGAHVDEMARPIWILRVFTALAIAAIGALGMGLLVMAWRGLAGAGGLVEVLQGTESAVNEVILLAMAAFFLVSLETRVKRKAALRALHRLRGIVHVVDMHQLTKDPEYVAVSGGTTPSSPQRTLSPFELGRYLDYCSELFSLSSKVAALYAQSMNDPVVLEAVNDVESLAATLSTKVWQKIIVLGDRRGQPQ